MARLGPFFKYYGSKFRIAPKYPAPQHGLIVEPFAGSASYATLHHEKQVMLIERDHEVAYLWQWLINADADAIRALSVSLPEGTDLRSVDADIGGKLLMRQWQRVGFSKCWTVSKWGHLSGFWCARTRDRLADQVQAIRHWRVIHADATKVLPQVAATWFVDPPYQTQARVYGGAAPDFGALGRWCQALQGQVIVCEAPGATWLPFWLLTHAVCGPGGGGKSHEARPELIWTN